MLKEAANAYQRQSQSNSILPELFEIKRDLGIPCIKCGLPFFDFSERVYASRLSRLAEAGHLPSQYTLASHYRNGDIETIPKSQIDFLKWLKVSAEGGYSRSCAVLGDFYHLGHDVEISYTEARKWYELAPNSAIAQDGLAHLYRDGNAVAKDREKAMSLFQKSAEQGYPFGLYDYGTELFVDGRIEEALV